MMDFVKKLRGFSYVGSVTYVAQVQRAKTILPPYIELRLKTPPPVAKIASASNKLNWKMDAYPDRIYINRGRECGIMHDLAKKGKPFFIDASELRTHANEEKILTFFKAFRPQHLSLV